MTKEMCFTIFWREKRLFRLLKQQVKKVENWGFPKGLVHGFGEKLALFSYYYFREKGPGKCVLRYSGEKKRLYRL